MKNFCRIFPEERKQRMDTTYTRPTDKTIISRTVLIILMDILATVACFFCGLWLRFDFQMGEIDGNFIEGFVSNMLVWCTVTVAVFALFRLYSSVWLYVSTSEVFRIIGAYCVLAVIGVTGIHFYGVALPRSSCIIGFVFSFLCTVAIRFSYRLIKTLQIRFSQMLHATGIPNVMVIGAGDAGRAIAEEFITSEAIGEHLACFIDDNPGLKHKRLCGVPVAGNRKSIPEVVKKFRVDKIIFAIPSASPATRKNILEICCTTGCQVLVLPTTRQLENCQASIQKLQKVSPQDLLGRERVEVRREEIESLMMGKTVLVTGGAGTVGKELCRQIAPMHPRTLVLLDLNEKASYDVQTELLRDFPELEVRTFVGSAQKEQTVKKVMESCRPDLVFHAAAYKYVSYMENSPEEAVANNVLATWYLAREAMAQGVSRFLLISTDRAEEASGITGATKQLSERIMEQMNGEGKTRFASVRFGNLLDNSGNVVDLFRKQIEQGGPVTVTHPDVTRYFMNVEDTARLILQTMVYVEGGEIFALDMGEPVKIDTMARSLIRLSGFEPDSGVKIQYIGLRPGEKLHEDPVVRKEGFRETGNRRIYSFQREKMGNRNLEEQLAALEKACSEDGTQVKALVSQLVPTYRT